MKKVICLIVFNLFFLSSLAFAIEYVPLAPIEGYVTQGTVGAGLESYIGNMYKLGVGIATLLAVLMVIWGGVEYMTTDAWGHKEEGKERIRSALFGLMLALGSFLIIETIDKSILDINFSVLDSETNKLIVEDQFALNIPDVVDSETRNLMTGPRGRAATMRRDGIQDLNVLGGVTDGTLQNSNFTNSNWYNHALELVQNSNLPNLSPADAAKYFPNGEATPQNWVKLLAGITAKESSFNPNTTYPEKFLDRNGDRVVSTGLMQISQESARGYGFSGITTEELKNPYKNLEVGVKILEHWVEKDGVISGKSGKSYYGGARYWATLR